MQKTLAVIGIGNLLRRDDAIGIILLGYLQKNKKYLSSNIMFIDGGTIGMNLLHLLQRHQFVFLIDAVDYGGEPGDWSFFSYDQAVSLKSPEHISTHISDIFQVIQLVKELNQKRVHLYVFGIQPYDISFGQGLSPPLQNNLTELKNAVAQKLDWMMLHTFP